MDENDDTNDSKTDSRRGPGGAPMSGPLAGVRVLDLSRVLAGPHCTQILGDMGADVIKIERPGAGDDTRSWGPPYLTDDAGSETTESAYYLACNRNKRSVAIDISVPAGSALVQALVQRCDILVENFKVGGLRRYGLAYEQVKERAPKLIYASITGFGQDGPYAQRPGYDYLIQGMGGIMSVTGEPDGEPMKVGVAVADIMCGMYAVTAILGALHHRDVTGAGQHIDVALLDTQVAWLANVGQSYLTSSAPPKRYGNAHATVVPYQVFATADGHIILAVGNDTQFARFCEFAGIAQLAADERFRTNAGRVRNRDALISTLNEIMRTRASAEWIAGLEAAGVPAGPILSVPEVFDDPQVRHREMAVHMQHPLRSAPVELIGSPIKYSATPVEYRHAPPPIGHDTDAVLAELLNLDAGRIAALRKSGAI
jgi:crotonobetainyl-CoA:carnitine CoA-transferase CaiB-like acyl-CoA transferase